MAGAMAHMVMHQRGLMKEPERLSGMWEKQRSDKETEHECE